MSRVHTPIRAIVSLASVIIEASLTSYFLTSISRTAHKYHDPQSRHKFQAKK